MSTGRGWQMADWRHGLKGHAFTLGPSSSSLGPTLEKQPAIQRQDSTQQTAINTNGIDKNTAHLGEEAGDPVGLEHRGQVDVAAVNALRHKQAEAAGRLVSSIGRPQHMCAHGVPPSARQRP